MYQSLQAEQNIELFKMHHETNLRSLLIKLQDSLSDSDRCRLHFLFGNVIPRKLRDDPSINGTLHVIESLFDRGLIDDQDFSYLIQAFREIHRPDIAKRLKGLFFYQFRLTSICVLSNFY